jgi:hypothetical protein
MCSGLASPSTSVEPKDPALGKRSRGDDTGKRVRKVNPIYADFSMDKVHIKEQFFIACLFILSFI